MEVENGKTFNLAQYVAINPSNATDKERDLFVRRTKQWLQLTRTE
ncbi:MAG: hypothetical protein ACLUVG_18120 [Phocaeicola vulgatus]